VGWPYGVVACLENAAGKGGALERGDFCSLKRLLCGGFSTRKRSLEGELKPDQAGIAGEEGLKVFNGLQERIGLGTFGRRLAAAQQAAKRVEAAAQALAEVVKSFQGEGQAQGMGGAFERGAGQQGNQEFAQQRGGERVAGKHVGQENGEGMAATAAIAAIGAEDALAAQRLTGGVGGIVAVEEAVSVQGADAVAALAALLFEGKSCWFNASQSRTK
jgi:hypothetical protein